MGKQSGGNRNECAPINNHFSVISIIIVTRNAEAYIQHCLDSIKIQKFQNVEVIIFDGASTDSTVELLQKNNHLITYWQSEPDNGIYEAMNAALKKATGTWFLFLGVDDILLPAFSDFATKLTQPNTIYFGDCITDKGEKLDGNFSAYRLTKMNICHQGICYPKAVFKKYSYQPKYRVYADYALNIQCWGDATFPKKYFPICITKYHSNGFSSFEKDKAFVQDKPYLIKKYLSLYIYLRYSLKQWKEKRKQKRGNT